MKTSKFFFSFTALLLTLLCSSLQASAYDYYDSYSSYYYDGTAEMEEALRKGHAAATLEDYVTAESYFLQAANLGSAEAQCCLGIIYSDPEEDNRTVLHFQIRKETTKLDPELWLKK